LDEHDAQVIAFDTGAACFVQPGAQRLRFTSSDVLAGALGNDRLEADGYLRYGHTFMPPGSLEAQAAASRTAVR
jgi:hypothetical protein